MGMTHWRCLQMTITQDPYIHDGAELVRLVYHYRDGHEFTTDPMLRRQALVYMPVLHAVPVDGSHYEAAFGSIELLDA